MKIKIDGVDSHEQSPAVSEFIVQNLQKILSAGLQLPQAQISVKHLDHASIECTIVLSDKGQTLSIMKRMERSDESISKHLLTIVKKAPNSDDNQVDIKFKIGRGWLSEEMLLANVQPQNDAPMDQKCEETKRQLDCIHDGAQSHLDRLHALYDRMNTAMTKAKHMLDSHVHKATIHEDLQSALADLEKEGVDLDRSCIADFKQVKKDFTEAFPILRRAGSIFSTRG